MFSDLRFRLRAFLRRRSVDDELDEELRFHFDQQVEKHVRSGLSREEALRRTRWSFGGLDQLKEEVREARGIHSIETIEQDVLYAVRGLRRSPGFAGVAILTLALGIGANTAIFSMVNALLLHPYDFRDLDRLVRVWEYRGVDAGFDARLIAPGDAADFAASSGAFDALATYRCRDFNLTAHGDAQPAPGCNVSGNFFDLLGVTPAVGRTFIPEEHEPGRDQVVVVSHGFWQRRFGGSPNLLGSNIQLNGRPYTVIGIMPPRFDYPVPMEFWTPLALTPAEKIDRADLSVEAIGRLKPAVSLAQARSALETLSRQFAEGYPVTNGGRAVSVLQLRKELYTFTLPLFLLLQAAAAFVLLLACANLINVLFARIVGRKKEMAMRLALGAGYRRLAQLLICESLLVSAVAATAAIAVSFWSVRALRVSISPEWTKWVPGWDAIRVDPAVLAFTLLVALSVGVLSSLVAVAYTRKLQLHQALKEGGPGTMTRPTRHLRGALVVAQVMLALILLVCAGLTIQGFTRLAAMYQGFDPAGVLKAELSLPEKKYESEASVTSFYEELLRRTAALPGASSVALSSNNPASNVDNATTLFTSEGSATLGTAETPSADLQLASPEYFPALHIPLVAGRLFSHQDDAKARAVVLISSGMAGRFWPGGGAVGRRIKLGPPDSNEPWLTVAGVVGDVRQNWWNPPLRPVIYRPFLQSPDRSMKLLVRTASPPQANAAPLREIVRTLDPELALNGVDSLEGEVADSIAIVRIMGILMGIFGLVALALSAVGVYGVLSESVAQRTHEFGIRLALGAHPAHILRQVVAQSLKLTAIGLVIAVPFSFAISRAIAHYVFGIVSMGAAVPLIFAAVLMAVGVLAGYLPAKRAMRVDPIITLRYE